MRLITVGLTVLLILLQYPLWRGYGSWPHVHALEQQLVEQQQKNAVLRKYNERRAAEVKNLQHGLTATEERARYELGMIKNGEVFVQFVSPNTPPTTVTTTQSLMRERGKVFTTPTRIVPDPPARRVRPPKREKAR